MTATLLYEGDQWLSTGSLVLMGVFTERKPLVRAVCKMIRERLDDNFDPSQYDKECLREDYEGCRNDYVPPNVQRMEAGWSDPRSGYKHPYARM